MTALVSLSEGVPLEDVLVQVWTNATKSGKWTPKDMHLEERVSVYRIEPPGGWCVRIYPQVPISVRAGSGQENRVRIVR